MIPARLALFLLYRELCIARFREFRDKIETRSREKPGPNCLAVSITRGSFQGGYKAPLKGFGVEKRQVEIGNDHKMYLGGFCELWVLLVGVFVVGALLFWVCIT